MIFAAAEPVSREVLARAVGQNCSIELLIDDLRDELRDRRYDIVAVAGGWQHRSRSAYASAIRVSQHRRVRHQPLCSEHEAAVLAAIAYLQPVTRGDLFDKEVSSDTIASLRDAGLLGSGRHSPTPGASYTYVTTKHFLSTFGMEMLRDLPDLERLEDAALLSTLDEATGPPGAMSRRRGIVVDRMNGLARTLRGEIRWNVIEKLVGARRGYRTGQWKFRPQQRSLLSFIFSLLIR
ncbi:chromosome segregation and condensation protein ScpB [Rhizobium mesoamericanum]|uniref:SMC-Scp complex subunit ScpB n=1 Tax=Rhizobium mesoamericanum TaxID=1079800 RepID=UPI002789A1A7|nr:chromosome segregation and condensation protein ScpB [Rhizobium mesoamericanum]